jgi:hypothetical protein
MNSPEDESGAVHDSEIISKSDIVHQSSTIHDSDVEPATAFARECLAYHLADDMHPGNAVRKASEEILAWYDLLPGEWHHPIDDFMKAAVPTDEGARQAVVRSC